MALARPPFWLGNHIAARCGERKSNHLPVTPEGKHSGFSWENSWKVDKEDFTEKSVSTSIMRQLLLFRNQRLFLIGISDQGSVVWAVTMAVSCPSSCRILALSLFSLHSHPWDRDHKLCSNSTETLCWLCIPFPHCPASLSPALALHYSCHSTATMSGAPTS